MQIKRMATFFLVVMFLVGCIPFMSGIDTWSPKKKAVYAMGLYIKHYDWYVTKLAFATGKTPDEFAVLMDENPAEAQRLADGANLTEAERIPMRQLKKILTNAWPIIEGYNLIVDAGQDPSPEMEAQLLNYIDAIESMALNFATQ